MYLTIFLTYLKEKRIRLLKYTSMKALKNHVMFQSFSCIIPNLLLFADGNAKTEIYLNPRLGNFDHLFYF